MKNQLSILLFSLTISLHAQQPATGPTFDFNTPSNWRGEVIPLPPGFAPDLMWKGIENIRFAPGMFKPNEDDFFSYLLVFLLEKDADVSIANIRKQILIYYQGLAKAVGGSKIPDLDPGTFNVDIKKISGKPVRPPTTTNTQKIDFFTGSLDWVEPFATRKAQTLHMEIHAWKHNEQPAIYFTVSPQPTDHEVWKTLREYRTKFSFGDR